MPMDRELCDDCFFVSHCMHNHHPGGGFTSASGLCMMRKKGTSYKKRGGGFLFVGRPKRIFHLPHVNCIFAAVVVANLFISQSVREQKPHPWLQFLLFSPFLPPPPTRGARKHPLSSSQITKRTHTAPNQKLHVGLFWSLFLFFFFPNPSTSPAIPNFLDLVFPPFARGGVSGRKNKAVPDFFFLFPVVPTNLSCLARQREKNVVGLIVIPRRCFPPHSLFPFFSMGAGS